MTETKPVASMAEKVVKQMEIIRRLDEIGNVPAGPEMNALVAERVMRCKRTPDLLWHGKGGWTFSTDFPALATNWSPSTDIAAAFEVVEETGLFQCAGEEVTGKTLRREGTSWVVAHRYGADIARAETAPLAICRAALKAVGAEDD